MAFASILRGRSNRSRFALWLVAWLVAAPLPLWFAVSPLAYDFALEHPEPGPNAIRVENKVVYTTLVDAMTDSVRQTARLTATVVGLIVCVGLVRPTARRLHDVDLSARWAPLAIVSGVGLLACLFWPGTKGPNRFGPDPRGVA